MEKSRKPVPPHEKAARLLEGAPAGAPRYRVYGNRPAYRYNAGIQENVLLGTYYFMVYFTGVESKRTEPNVLLLIQYVSDRLGLGSQAEGKLEGSYGRADPDRHRNAGG